MELQSCDDSGSNRHIEVMASIRSNDEFEKHMSVAKVITGSSSELIEQTDVCFNVRKSRLKLRYLQPPKRAHLSYYDRPYAFGPKLPICVEIEIAEAQVYLLEKILTQTNGVRGILEKRRHLFMHGTTRIYLDEVTDLGKFFVIEVCLSPEQSIKEGKKIANKLLAAFGIKEEDILTEPYFDELCNCMYNNYFKKL